MNALLYKDFKQIINIRMNWVFLALGVMYSIIAGINKSVEVWVVYFEFFSVYCIFLNLAQYDDKKGELINSLPVKKEDVVKSRYLSVVLYGLILTIILNFTTVAVSSLKLGELFDIQVFVYRVYLPIIIILLMIAVYMPLYIKFGTINMKYISFVTLFIIALLPTVIIRFGSEKLVEDIILKINAFVQSGMISNIVILLVCTLVFYVSMIICANIYRKKEF